MQHGRILDSLRYGIFSITANAIQPDDVNNRRRKPIATSSGPGVAGGTGSQTVVTLDSKALAQEVRAAVGNAMLPPTFHGKAGEDVEQWIRKVDKVSATLKWDAAEKLVQVPAYLDDFAGTWYDAETTDGTDPYTTYAEFSKAVKERFLTTDYKNQLKIELNRRKLQKVNHWKIIITIFCPFVSGLIGR